MPKEVKFWLERKAINCATLKFSENAEKGKGEKAGKQGSKLEESQGVVNTVLETDIFVFFCNVRMG